MSLISLTNNFNSLIGQPEDWTKAQQNFTDITTVVNGQLSDDNLASSAGVYTAYRTIHEAHGFYGLDFVATTYGFTNEGRLYANGSGNGGTALTPRARWIDDADFTISGRTAKLRVRAVVASNATAPAVNFTFGLAPVTVAGGADALTYSLGTAVAGGSVAINTPSASTATVGTGSDFSLPGDGLYALFVATSGTQANNNMSILHVWLEQRWT